MVECNVDDCGEDATFFYTWAWGEEGACCDGHRAHLESKSGQLGREITFTPTGEKTKREYKTPSLQVIAPEVGQLRMQLAALDTTNQELEAAIVERDERIGRLTAELRAARHETPPEAPAPSVIEGRPMADTPVERGATPKRR